MSEFLKQAREKLDAELDTCKGRHVDAMKHPVHDTLLSFCGQDGEFAQAVAQGGSFKDCMDAVAKNVGGAISDIEAYRRAVQFYFPGADIHFDMRIDLCAGVNTGAEPVATEGSGIVVNFDDFF